MDKKSTAVKKYEALISELKDLNKEQDDLIRIQAEEMDGLKKLAIQQEEKIDILTNELERTVQAAKEMAAIMNSILQN